MTTVFTGNPAKNLKLSGRQDLNLRPTAPKAAALPSCATSRSSQYITTTPGLDTSGSEILRICTHQRTPCQEGARLGDHFCIVGKISRELSID